MKILYSSASVIPSNNANSVNVMKMCNALSNSGHQVTLVASQNKNSINVDVYKQYNTTSNFNIIFASTGRLSSLRRLFKTLKAIKGNDIVYCRWQLSAFIVSFVFKKYIIFEHHYIPKGFFQKVLEKRLIKANRIKHVFITKALQEEYILKYKKIQFKDLIVLPDGADAQNEYNSPISMKNNVGYVGSFQKGKGLETVLELAQEMPKVTFHIIGGLAEEVELLSKANYQNIIWYGHKTQNELQSILKDNVHIALLPNYPDVVIRGKSNTNIGKWTSPLKMFEYMSFSKVIIASDLPVLREILTDGVNSILVPWNDINSWKKAINTVINNDDLYIRLSKQAYSDIRIKYSWEQRVKTLNQEILHKIDRERG